MIWGLAFVAQSVSTGHVGPWTFNAIRFFIGFFVLLPLAMKRKDKIKQSLKAAFLCALALTLASVAQQAGLGSVPAGKAGFITSLYMVLVPILSVIRGSKVTPKNWICVLLALFGLFLLCGSTQGGFGTGELLILVCAFFFAAQIILVDYFQDADTVALSAFQFLFAGLLSLIPTLLFEHPDFTAIGSTWIPILYTGIFSTGIAYTLQAVGERMVGPSVAVVPLSMESVFSALFGFLILGQQLRPLEILGCAIVFSAVLLDQISLEGHTKKAQ